MISLLEIAQSVKERASTDTYNKKSIGREDGETWDHAKGFAAKHNGEIRYFDINDYPEDMSNDEANAAAEKDAKVYAKTGKVANPKDAKKGDGDSEKDAGGKLGGSDFERDGGDDPIGDKGDVGVGELPDRSSELPKKTAKQQSDFEKKRDAMFKKARGGDTSTDGGADEPKTGDSESEDLNKVQSVDDVADIEDLRSDFDFGQRFDAVKDEDSGYKDEYDRPMSIDDLDFKVKMINAGESARDFLGPFESEEELAAAWKEATAKAMASKKESIKVINGKKYKAISEDRTASIIQYNQRQLDKLVAKPNKSYSDEEEIQRLRNAIAYAKSKQESVEKSNPRVLKEIYDRTFRSLK